MKKELREILEKIEASGYEAFLVGGYPRDFLLKRECSDYDICTNAPKEKIIELFPLIREENYGCFKIDYAEISVEITIYRKETAYVSVRTPIISYTSLLEEDLKRRDFTMNTICMDKDGQIVDLLSGVEDLKAGVIRSVLDPNKKMREDPLRMLRAIRFATTYHFSLEKSLKEAILENRELVRNLSIYRKKEELTKIFLSENAKYGLSLLHDLGVDNVLSFDASSLKVVPFEEGMWAQLDTSNYPFSKAERKKIDSLKALLEKEYISDEDLYRYGLKTCLLVYQIQEKEDDLEKRYQDLPIKSRKEIAISPMELADFPLDISSLYFLLERKILKGELSNSHEAILSFLKAYF